MDATDYKTWNNLAALLLNALNQPMEAAKCLAQAMKIDPNNPLGLGESGKFAWSAGPARRGAGMCRTAPWRLIRKWWRHICIVPARPQMLGRREIVPLRQAKLWPKYHPRNFAARVDAPPCPYRIICYCFRVIYDASLDELLQKSGTASAFPKAKRDGFIICRWRNLAHSRIGGDSLLRQTISTDTAMRSSPTSLTGNVNYTNVCQCLLQVLRFLPRARKTMIPTSSRCPNSTKKLRRPSRSAARRC